MLECRDLRVVFDGVAALDGATMSAPTDSITAVMGPSGSGKSTLLRVIAGLQRPDSGSVTWQKEDLLAIPPHRRNIGLMFQDYALFPHLTVRGNVGFGLRMRDTPAAAIDSRVDEVLAMVGMTGFADRGVDDLSGGEQQRVALARTLAPAPSLLLLDEPLGALDRALRTRLLGEMRDIFTELEVTVLYITHDTEEAFGIADRVAVMDAGKVVQSGTPEDLWTAPKNALVASLLGHPNVVDATALAAAGIAAPGGHGLVVAPPDAITLTAGTDAVVVESRFAATHFDVTVERGDVRLVVESEKAWPVGDQVGVTIEPGRMVTLDS